MGATTLGPGVHRRFLMGIQVTGGPAMEAAEHPGLMDHRPEVPWAPASALATAPTGGRLSTVTVRHTVRPAQRTREQDPLEPGLKVRTRPSKYDQGLGPCLPCLQLVLVHGKGCGLPGHRSMGRKSRDALCHASGQMDKNCKIWSLNQDQLAHHG